jgi:hypothetical protein
MRGAFRGLVIAGAVFVLVVGIVLAIGFALFLTRHLASAPQAPHSPASHSPGPPPGAETVTVLMNEEVAAVQDHDIISRIYAPDAFVEDAACGRPGGVRTWPGLGNIIKRYQGLGRFASLRHVDAKVQWQPDNSLADQATVTARTVGEMESGGGSLRPVYGNEVWHFARLPSGRWVITSFIYHVCLPPS